MGSTQFAFVETKPAREAATTTTLATTPFENFHFNLIEPRQNALPLALIGGETERETESTERDRGEEM